MHPLKILPIVAITWTGSGCEGWGSPETLGAPPALTAQVVPPGFNEGLVARFDASKGELPEGIAMDQRGGLYVGLRFQGEIRKLHPASTGGGYTQSVLATLDVGLLGLAVDRHGDVYAAVASFRPATHGVWRVARDGGKERLPGTGAIFFPNALTFDPQGNLYVTSSSGSPVAPGVFADGEIWRIAPDGAVQSWLRDPLLTGTNALDPPFPIGANGIAYHAQALIVANTERGRVLRVPIEPDGSAGIPAVVADGFTFVDGLAVDVHGDIYLLVIGASKLVRMAGDGSIGTDLAGPLQGVDFATSIVFGTGRGDRSSVFLANFAGFPSPVPNRPGPSVLKLDVGVPGLPVP